VEPIEFLAYFADWWIGSAGALKPHG